MVTVDQLCGGNFDDTVKSKFKWEWLSEEDGHDNFSDLCVKT